MNQLRVGAVLSYANLFASNVLALLVTPLMLRSLGQTEFGIYSLIGAFVAYIAVLDFGLGNAVIRYVAKFRAEGNDAAVGGFLRRSVELYLGAAALAVVVGGVAFLNLNAMFGDTMTGADLAQARRLFVLMVLNVAVSFPLSAYAGVVNAYEQFVFLRAVNLLRAVVRTAALVALLLLGYKALAIVVLDTALNLATGLLNVYFVHRRLRVRAAPHAFEPAFMRGLAAYSAFVFLNIIVDQLYWKIGHLVLGAISGPTSVAVFAVATQFTHYYMQFPLAVGGLFLPRVTAMVATGATADDLLEIFARTSRVQLLVLAYVLGGFVLFGREFITLWAGADYAGAWQIALVMMVPLTVPLFQTIGLHILQAKNMHQFRAVAYLVIAVVNVLVSIPLVRRWGPLGAAVATASSLVAGNIVAMNLYYRYKIGLDMRRFAQAVFARIVPSALAAAALGAVAHAIAGYSWPKLALRGGLYTLAYAIVMWRHGMNDYERELARSATAWLGRSRTAAIPATTERDR